MFGVTCEAGTRVAGRCRGWCYSAGPPSCRNWTRTSPSTVCTYAESLQEERIVKHVLIALQAAPAHPGRSRVWRWRRGCRRPSDRGGSSGQPWRGPGADCAATRAAPPLLPGSGAPVACARCSGGKPEPVNFTQKSRGSSGSQISTNSR